MARNKNSDVAPTRPTEPVLPPVFDAAIVENFFAQRAEALEEHFPDPRGASDAAIETANTKSPSDLLQKAQPVDADWLNDLFAGDDGETEPTGTEMPVDDTLDLDYAYAKPVFDGSGSGKGGKGRGKTKDNTDTTDTDTAGSTGSGSTDGTTGTDGTTDTGGTTGTGGTTDSGGSGSETNTGSTDPNIYVSGLDTPDGFNIEVEFSGNWTDAFKQVVMNVTEQLSDIITGDVASHNGIDDFHLLAIMNNIDGAGGYLGVGGTVTERPDSYLPSEGFLRIDESDAATEMALGTLEDVMFHEVLHSLGFGTIWTELGLVQNINGELRFTGSNAIEAYNDIFGDIAANDPFSDLGVKVSADGAHWDHATFTHEVMTTSIYNSGNYASDMTIAALEDMGYETIYEPGALLA